MVFAVALAAAACGGPQAVHKPSPTPHPTSAGNRGFDALIWSTVSSPDVQGHSVITLYSSADGQARVIASPLIGGEPQFMPDGRISYAGTTQVLSVDRAGGQQRTEAVSCGQALILAYGWSHDGTLAYLEGPPYGSASGPSRLVIRPASGPRVEVALPTLLHVYQQAGDQTTVQFSPNGRLLLVVDTALDFRPGTGAGQSPVQVRRPDGSLVFAAPWNGSVSTMPSGAVWGADGRLYYSDGRGVNVFDPRTMTERTLLSGARWFDPSPSPDGHYIAFELRDAQQVPGLRLLDVSTGTMDRTFLRPEASHPTFVSPSRIWFHEEVACSTCRGATNLLDPIISRNLANGAEIGTGLTGTVTAVQAVPRT